MNNIEVVKAFMNAVSAHDLATLTRLMSEDHIFIDSLGNSVHGRDKMIAGWKQYFAFCPDYWLSHEEFLGARNIGRGIWCGRGHGCCGGQAAD